MVPASVAAALVATPLVFTAPAHADAGGFIEAIDDSGISYPTTSSMLGIGVAACQELHGGKSVRAVVNDIVTNYPYGYYQAGEILGAAAVQICPDELGYVAAWANAQLSREGQIV
jgi:hypothetical protein